uniref:4-coumarate--CoA ligase n=1 Tax=Oryza barthii TaxID=65489 RepID=A0A0D3FWZ1_9ORYZ
MDPKRSIDDQFSKLHPSLPVDTRIGIVGAGPSGLSAAYALAKLGYRNVTLFEKCHTVSGMCESIDIEGRIYDLGGQVIAANSAPVITHLAKELGSDFEEMDTHKLSLIDSQTGNIRDLEVAEDYVSMVSLTLKLQDEANKSGRAGLHALSGLASDPTHEFLKQNGINSMPKSVAYGYTASGYGFVQDMPYAFIQEFTRTSMAGKIRRFKHGYMSMWERLSKSLPFEVFCDTEVLNVKRNSCGANVTIKNNNGEKQVLEFDKIILSGAVAFKNSKTYRSSSLTDGESEVVELNNLERELFSKVQTIDYYTTVVKINGFEHIPKGFYYFGEFMEDPTTIGHPVAMQRFFADTNIFLFWSYGNSADIKGSFVAKCVTDVVSSMGGNVQKVILQRRFKYFPHVSSKDMKDGFYERLESQLQGFQNTYYVGGLLAFELTERNASYSIMAVCKHFAIDGEGELTPYVKRLFPLSHNRNPSPPRDLGELEGVEFPDLPSLDGYLQYWGTHKVTEKNVIYTWINEEGKLMNRRTYQELHGNASYIAQKLLTSTKPVIKPGDRVLLIHLPGLEFIDAFFGCIRAGVIPVPVLPPDPMQSGGQALLKVENISKMCNAVAILSTSSYHAAVRAGYIKNIVTLAKRVQKCSAQWPDIPWIHTDSWIKNYRRSSDSFNSDTVLFTKPQPSDLCFLQFTSGSTGDAKGVMITHEGLIHNVKTMKKRYRSTSKTVLVSWLPQYHDMGLIGGLFTALVSGGTSVLFSPMTFIRNPLLWLQTINDYHGTHSAGPNFAFELVIRRLEAEKNKVYDLSSMVFLMIAAEPVRQKTVRRFIELTQPFGLSEGVLAPGYGLAENCVYVTCAFGECKPVFIDWQGRVCCGYVEQDDTDTLIRIVDPDSLTEHQEDGVEGEIWISSPSSGVGYWGNSEMSQRTFFNQLKNHPNKKFTRTGDLGRTIDGNLFITGRIKDLIIVAGRNIYSADVEKTVESSSEVLRPGCCAVVGIPEEVLAQKGISIPDSSDQVGLVVIAEVREGKAVSEEVVNNIKARVVEEHGVAVASVKLIKPRTICKTTSGKIRRFECMRQFVDNTLSLAKGNHVSKKKGLFRSLTTGTSMESKRSLLRQTVDLTISHWPKSQVKNSNEITEFLTQIVSEHTGISKDKISLTDSLPSYGFDSIAVVRAAQKLSDFLGVPVGAIDIFTASCISELASFLENLVHKSQPQLAPWPKSKVKNSKEIIEFLTKIVSDQTGIPKDKISPTDSLPSYGFDSIAVVQAAQKLSDFLGVPVGAIDIFTAGCISELATFLENLAHKSQSQLAPGASCYIEDETQVDPMDAISPEFSVLGTGILQLLALTYVCFVLLLPAYLASSTYMNIFSTVSLVRSPLLSYLSSLVMAPIVWIFYISLTSLSLSILGKSFLQPNYVLIPDVSIWSVDFVKWWALNKAQALAAKMLAVHLKGTIFLNYWFKMQGARIGSSVVIDTVDITDPSLLTVADGAVLAEGALVQGHEVCNEVLSFRPIWIGCEASIGPYAVLQKGTVVEDGAVVPPLQKTGAGKSTRRTSRTSVSIKKEAAKANMILEHLVSIYAVGILGALSGAIVYTLYTHLSGKAASPLHFSFACIAGAFHWLPAAITAYAVIVQETPTSALSFALFTAFAYLSYGVILSILTSITSRALAAKPGTKQNGIASLIHRRITISAHVRFAKMLSGTEAFCVYLRLLGAKIGRHCSIRAINPVANPELISVGDGVHLGDFCNIIPGFYSKGGFTSAEIKVQENTVVGSASLLLPGCVLQENVILGALSVAPENAVLRRGGVYVGSQSPAMVKNTLLDEDERIEEMDQAYKKIVGNLAANLAITTMNVKSRYFHRIGVSGRGVLRMYEEIPSFPRHKIFASGKSFPVIVRHSNSLSADDDARLDARGAAVRILSDNDGEAPLLDLTLKSGKAFYARTIADFATWLVCGLPAREEQVKRSPHIRDAVWGSLRSTDSYTVLHYYSNICRLLRFDDGREMYAKFKLRPADPDVPEDSGKVVPRGILPPETGAIPRDEDDTRPLLFLADDFRRRVGSPDGVRYVFQLQLREVPTDAAARDVALDCTRPWDEAEFPYIDVGEVSIGRNLPTEETEKLEFNPFLRCPEVDVIPATSCAQSASIDHGRSLVYEICQRLRNGEPLPASWRAFLEQSDTKIDLSGCPVAAAVTPTRSNAGDATKVTLARTWYQALWATLCQPLLQTLVPYSVLGLVIFLPLRGLLAVAAATRFPLYWLLPAFWAASGVAAMATCAAAKWALVGSRVDGDTAHIWSPAVFLDTVWQAVRAATAEYFAELTPGSAPFAAWMRVMGASVSPGDGVYVDSMGALLNPEMVRLERGAAVGRDALLFGHVYEGEAGKVKFGAVSVGEDGFVGSRAVAMPSVTVDDGGCLAALGLAMKGETVKHSM